MYIDDNLHHRSFEILMSSHHLVSFCILLNIVELSIDLVQVIVTVNVASSPKLTQD